MAPRDVTTVKKTNAKAGPHLPKTKQPDAAAAEQPPPCPNGNGAKKTDAAAPELPPPDRLEAIGREPHPDHLESIGRAIALMLHTHLSPVVRQMQFRGFDVDYDRDRFARELTDVARRLHNSAVMLECGNGAQQEGMQEMARMIDAHGDQLQGLDRMISRIPAAVRDAAAP